MNPYHRYDDPLERARAEAGDKRKDTMLKAFREQIVGLAAVLEPEERRGRMGKLIEEWHPALEDVEMDREHLERVLRKIRERDSNDIGRLAKATIDLFYQARDRSVLAETAVVQRGSWGKAVKKKGVTLGRPLSESVLPNLPSWSVKGKHTRKANESEELELESDANKLGADELKDEEDKEWIDYLCEERLMTL